MLYLLLLFLLITHISANISLPKICNVGNTLKYIIINTLKLKVY